MVVSNDTLSAYAAPLSDTCNVIVADVVTSDLSVKDAMNSYKEQTSSMIEEMLASLNN